MTPPDLIAERAGRSARWAVLQSAGKHGVDLLVFLCLARLVAPQAFGLVAMASAVIVLATVLAEMGLGDALVQRRDLRPDHADTAFWSALAIGALLASALFVVAPLVGAAYAQPDLVPVLRALSALFVIHALNVVPQAMLQRELAFRTLTLRSLAGSLLGGFAGLGMALCDGGAWSLVAQQLVSASVGLLGLWWFSPWRPGRKATWRSAGELFRFSRFVVGARVLNVAASKADDVVVGLMLGPAALGFYNVGCRMQLALEQLFCQGIDAVALSAFSRVEGATERVRELYAAATRTAALFAFPIFGGAIVLAPDIILALVGPAWLPTAPLLRWLLLAGLLQAVTHFDHAVFKAAGRPELTMRMAAASTMLNVATLLVAVRYGIEAVALSCFVRSALIGPVGVVLACRMVGMPLRRYVAGLLRPALGLALAAMLVHHLQGIELEPGHPAAQPWFHLALMGAAGLLAYLAFTGVTARLWPQTLLRVRSV